MGRGKTIVLIVIGIVLIAVGVAIIPTVWFKPWKIDHFYVRVFAQYVLRRPQFLTSARLLEPLGFYRHNAKLDNHAMRFAEKEGRWMERQLRILRRYDRESMDDASGLSYDILEWWMADELDGYRFINHDYPVTPRSGVHIDLPDFIINEHRVDDLRGARHYVRRLSRYGDVFDQVIEGIRVREEMGILPPRFVIENALADIEEFVAVGPQENVLALHLAGALDEIADLDTEKGEKILRSAVEEIGETVYPAYGRLAEELSRQRLIADDNDGVWKHPDGPDYYAYRLRHFTTTDMNAETIHEVGLREVDRIQAEMRDIFLTEGLPARSIQETVNLLNENEAFLYPDTDTGRAQIIADFQKIIDQIDADSGNFLGVRPEVGVKVERIPEFKEAKASRAYYTPGPLDRSKPGTFYVNLRDIGEIKKFDMRTMAYHEAIPGHHVQLTIARELKNVPIFRRVIPFTAYTEGWALYAERLAVELGYQDDPNDRLGYHLSELYRAVRLVVDTGIHEKKWTREEAIAYMLANTGKPEITVISEIERYIVDPGQACAYKVGELQVRELRERAENTLGHTFDIREFHNVLLTDGAMPLHILEDQVNRFIAKDGAKDA